MIMSIEAFRDSVRQDVHLSATQNRTFPRDEFLIQYTEDLIEAEEFTDFEQVQYESSGSRRGSVLQIDGYYYDELDQSLGIFLCDFTDTLEAQTLTMRDVKALFKREENFVTDSLNGFIQQNAEESSPGYGLAVDINVRYKNVRSYKFYIISDRVKSRLIKEIPIGKIGDANVEYYIWDISRLQSLRESRTGKEDIIIDLREFGIEGIPCLEASRSDDYTAYLCNIPGKVLADLYNTYGGRLLEGNVRSFLTVRGKINKGIRNTILNDPSKFFAYNNGVAATAYEIKTRKGLSSLLITELTGLQIVNGGQTTASLAAALINDKARANDLKNIFVPMKLSVVSPNNAMNLIPDIARYANSQNKVSEADFFSNSPFHVRIESISRKLLAPAVNGNQFGTHWYYERARGQYRQEQFKMTSAQQKKFKMENPKNQVISKTDLAKYYHINAMKPDVVSLGAQKNFIQFAEWAGKAWKNDESGFNEDFFKNIVAVDILFHAVDNLVRKAFWYEGGYKAQVNTYTLSLLFYLIQKKYPDRTFDLRRVWASQAIAPEVQAQLEDISYCVYKQLTDPGRGVQNVTEWAKKSDCWETMKAQEFSLRDDFIRSLAYKSADSEKKKDARIEQKEINKANAMIEVANYGVKKWKNLKQWGIQNHIFNSSDISFLNTAIGMERGNFPSDRQCVKILKVLEKAREESYPD